MHMLYFDILIKAFDLHERIVNCFWLDHFRGDFYSERQVASHAGRYSAR
ncbi:hypothetical protein HGB07_05265 [Candidatus Roizmanbacteria bacterium]|nr:hypothetical protein [Candidatus Roizmanbacteria bacterium]